MRNLTHLPNAPVVDKAEEEPRPVITACELCGRELCDEDEAQGLTTGTIMAEQSGFAQDESPWTVYCDPCGETVHELFAILRDDRTGTDAVKEVPTMLRLLRDIVENGPDYSGGWNAEARALLNRVDTGVITALGPMKILEISLETAIDMTTRNNEDGHKTYIAGRRDAYRHALRLLRRIREDN